MSSAQDQSDTSSKHKVTPQDAVNLAVPDEDVSELAEGPEVVNPGGQKRKAENEATYNEVAEVSQEIIEFGDVLCAAFKSWKESLVKPKSVEDPEDDGKTPVNKISPTSTTKEEKPELADGSDEEEVRRDPAQEVQAVSKKEATKEIVFFGYPRNSQFSIKQLARSTRETERWLQEADEEVKQKWLKDIEDDKSKFHDRLQEFEVDEQEQWK